MHKYSYEKLLKLITDEIPLKPSTPTFGITFIGPPGVGKTTVAKLISKKTGIFITSNDRIRREFEKLGINAEEEQDLVASIAKDRSEYMLKNKINMIIDATMTYYYNSIKSNFDKYNSKIFFVELKCPENVILKRIDDRAKSFGEDNENYSRAGRDSYFKYLEKLPLSNFPKEEIFFSIDTNGDIEAQVDELVLKIYREIESL